LCEIGFITIELRRERMTDWKDEETSGIVRVGHGENKGAVSESPSVAGYKACPFCGNEINKYDMWGDNWTVNNISCRGCGVVVTINQNEEEAIDTWNKRAL